jgi:hypothetical protein
VFPTVLVHPVADETYTDESLANLIIVATEGAPPTKAFLQRRWDELREEAGQAPDLRQAIRSRRDRPLPLRDVPTLTDDYAPTDALLILE